MDTYLEVDHGEVYEILGQIGSGGGGTVYKAFHKRLQKMVVIKELTVAMSHQLEVARNETEALKNVKSEYLPQVLDLIISDNRVYTVMEFISGESFDKLLERGQTFSQQQVIIWYGQLSQALLAIHRNHIYHRDIKPANIMLLPSGDVCLIDFNMAGVVGNDMDLINRSYGYASPEQFDLFEKYKNGIPVDADVTQMAQDASQAPQDADDNRTVFAEQNITGSRTRADISAIDWQRSDIYSLGATMYHLLTGQRPNQISNQVIPLSQLGKFSQGLTYILEKSMATSPNQRFEHIQALHRAIQTIKTHDARFVAARAKRRCFALILTLCMVCFGAMTYYGYWTMGQEAEEQYYDAVYAISNDPDPYEAFEAAIALFDGRVEPYVVVTNRLWDDGDFTSCQTFLEANLGNLAKFLTTNPEDVGYLYYVLGNCYLEEENLTLARDYLEIAVELSPQSAYLRDYAITLVSGGDVEGASAILENLSTTSDLASFQFLAGEIASEQGDTASAIAYFTQVLSNPEDSYMAYRTYIALYTAYVELEQYQEAITLLEDANTSLPIQYTTLLPEYLAQAYTLWGDYEAAITYYESMAPSFQTLQNIAILYQNLDDFTAARATLLDMEERYPDQQQVYLRLSYLELDYQATLDNASRDYTAAYEAYLQCLDLSTSDTQVDVEFQKLESMIAELITYGWITPTTIK